MKNFNAFLVLCLMTSNAMAAAYYKYEYTQLDNCTFVEEEGSEFSKFNCDAKAPNELQIIDQGQYNSLLIRASSDEAFQEINLRQAVSAPGYIYREKRSKAEWLMFYNGKDNGKPLALTLRMRHVVDETFEEKGNTLVVIKLAPSGSRSCIVGTVDATKVKDANKEAREIALQAQALPCKFE